VIGRSVRDCASTDGSGGPLTTALYTDLRSAIALVANAGADLSVLSNSDGCRWAQACTGHRTAPNPTAAIANAWMPIESASSLLSGADLMMLPIMNAIHAAAVTGTAATSTAVLQRARLKPRRLKVIDWLPAWSTIHVNRRAVRSRRYLLVCLHQLSARCRCRSALRLLRLPPEAGSQSSARSAAERRP
jgi:hypothetical protein